MILAGIPPHDNQDQLTYTGVVNGKICVLPSLGTLSTIIDVGLISLLHVPCLYTLTTKNLFESGHILTLYALISVCIFLILFCI